MTYRMYETTDERLDRLISEELAAHATLGPPWAHHRELPRRSLGSRMGGGELYMWAWQRWWERLDRGERDAYRARWAPPEPGRGWLPEDG